MIIVTTSSAIYDILLVIYICFDYPRYLCILSNTFATAQNLDLELKLLLNTSICRWVRLAKKYRKLEIKIIKDRGNFIVESIIVKQMSKK